MYDCGCLQADDVAEPNNHSVELVKQKLLDHHLAYMDKTQTYDSLYEAHSRISQEVQLKHQALDAFKETVAVFKDQLKLHENFHKQAAQHEMGK